MRSNTEVRSSILGPQHSDIKYLQQDNIGAVLSKGLAATYEQRPRNAVEYFAKWLLNYRETQKAALEVVNKNKQREGILKDYQSILKNRQEEESKKQRVVEEHEATNKKFWESLQVSEDLNDNLTELANYLHKNLKATGVYIGTLEPKMKQIQSDDDENAHIDQEAPLVLKFKHANANHEGLMVGKVLEQTQGICHSLFKEGEEEEEAPAAEATSDDGTKDEAAPKDIISQVKHVFIEEVVENKDVHFWKVPRLGSFMAIPLIYKSCLSEAALDEAIVDWAEVSKQIEAQDKERADWEEEQAQIKDDKEKSGEPYEPEERQWKDLQAAPFRSIEKKFVICIDTLGQDRKLTDDQKRFALQTTVDFKDAWEKFEHDKLVLDRDMRMRIKEEDREYAADSVDRLKDDEDRYVQERLNEEEDIEDEDEKNLASNRMRLEYQAKLFKDDEEVKRRFDDLKQFKVIKYGKFMQALLYFLGYPKDGVVEPGSQKFFWKTAKNYLDEDFLERMEKYDFRNPKPADFKKYQTLNYIETIIAGIDPVEVDEFNFAAGRLYRWLKFALDNRKLDIIRRTALILKEREERDSKIKQKEERMQKREAELDEAKKKFAEDHKEEIDAYEAFQKTIEAGADEYGEEEEEEEPEEKPKEPPTLPVFDEETFLQGWDVENPDIIISPNMNDDVDNDWVLSAEERDEEIKRFWHNKENS